MSKTVLIVGGLIVVVVALAIANLQPTFGSFSEAPSGKYSPTEFGGAAPMTAHTPAHFVGFFNEEMKRNKFRVHDWPGVEVFRLRLSDVEVGDGVAIYEGGKYILPWRTNSLKVICRFTDPGDSRTINNGDAVDLEGKVAVADLRWVRIVVELSPCHLIEYES